VDDPIQLNITRIRETANRKIELVRESGGLKSGV